MLGPSCTRHTVYIECVNCEPEWQQLGERSDRFRPFISAHTGYGRMGFRIKKGRERREKKARMAWPEPSTVKGR